MTLERQDIVDSFYSGNSKTIRVTIRDDSGNLKDLANAEITYALFGRETETVYIYKASYNGTNEIQVVGTGVCDIFLKPSDTANLYGTYRHHVNVVDANGDEETVLSGKVEIHKAMARRQRHYSTAAYLQG